MPGQSLGDILGAYYGSEGFPAYPEPQAGGLRPGDVLAAVREATYPPKVIGDVASGAYGSLLDVAQRNIEASRRQEVDPGAAISGATLAMGATPFGMPARGGGAVVGGPRPRFDPTTVGSGIPLMEDWVTTQLDPRALDRAFRATGGDFYNLIPGRMERLKARVEAGDPVAIAEVGAYNDAIGFINGRHRARLAAESGMGDIPVAVERGNEQAVQDLVSQYRRDPGTILGAGPTRRPAGAAIAAPALTERPLGERLLQAAEEPSGPVTGYDFLTGRRPDAPFPQYADVYPPTGPPTMTPRGAGKEGTYPAKTLTPEAEAVAKAREKIIEDMRREGYQPFFDPSQRFPAEFEKQPGPHVDTAAAVAKKQETIDRHLQTIGAPETLARLREGYSRGLDLPDAQAWYMMGQVERKMIESMGEEAGRKHFRDSLATAMATTTTGMSPPQNLIMAQYLNYLRATGQPFPTEAWQTPVAVGGQRTMPNVEAYAKAFSDPRGPYESLGLQNPKRVDFAQAQMGNPNAFTVDEQMAHGMLGVDVPTVGTYGLVTKVGREEAARAGVEPQRYQDVGWAGFKKMLEEQARAKKGLPPLGPGEGYQGAPEISHVNDMIERIHRLTGRPRQEVWHKIFIEHSIPVYGLGGLTLGGVLQGQTQSAAPLE